DGRGQGRGHRVEVRRLGGVASEGQGVPAQGLHLLGHAVDAGGGQSADRHISAGFSKGQGDALANAASASYNQYFLSCDVERGDAHYALPWLVQWPLWSRFNGYDAPRRRGGCGRGCEPPSAAVPP